MKKTIPKTLVAALIMAQLSVVQAQETQKSAHSKPNTMKISQTENANSGHFVKDSTAIKSCITTYFTACIKGDSHLLKQAFHPSCHLKHITEDNELFDVGLDHFIHFLDKNGSMPILETKIADIEQFGPMAKAKALFIFKEFIYVDYLHLLKEKEQWRIVDKVYVKQML